MTDSPERRLLIAAIDKALQHVADLCSGKERWTMRIPANPTRDSDFVISEALRAAKDALLAQPEAAQADGFGSLDKRDGFGLAGMAAQATPLPEASGKVPEGWWAYVEFGHRAAERGLNIEAALDEARTLLAAAHPPEASGKVPLDPTPEMIEAGAQRLVRWEDNCKWPDSWSGLDVLAARNDAERCWRSMWLAAAPSAEEKGE